MKLWKSAENFLKANVRGKPRPLGTQEQYRRNLDRFFNAAEVTTEGEALQLTQADAFAARDWLMGEGGLAQGTVKAILATARSYYEVLVAYQAITINPLSNKHLPPEGSPVPMWNVLKEGEAEKLLAGIKGTKKMRDRAVFFGLLLHGWRASELARLTWDDLEKQGGRVGFRYKTKGHGDRYAWQPADATFIKAAERWSGRTKGKPVVPREKYGSKPVDRQGIYRIVTKWTKRILGRKVTPHGLRASCITRVGEKYGPGVAQAFVGHSSLAVTKRYLRGDVELRGLPPGVVQGDTNDPD